MLKTLKTIKNQQDSGDVVAHLSASDVRLMCICASQTKKDGWEGQTGRGKDSGFKSGWFSMAA